MHQRQQPSSCPSRAVTHRPPEITALTVALQARDSSGIERAVAALSAEVGPALSGMRALPPLASAARGRDSRADLASRAVDLLLESLVRQHGLRLSDLVSATGWKQPALSMRLRRLRQRQLAD